MVKDTYREAEGDSIVHRYCYYTYLLSKHHCYWDYEKYVFMHCSLYCVNFSSIKSFTTLSILRV